MHAKDFGGAGPLSRGNRNRVYGIGPSVAMPVFAKGGLVGLVSATCQIEFGARANFEANVFIVGSTLAKLHERP